MKKVLVRIGCIQVFFAKTKRPIQPRLDQSLKGSSPRNQKTNTKINNHLGLSILDIYAKKMRLKTNNDLGCSAFTFSMQLNLEFAFNFLGFAVFRFMFTKRRKKVVNPRAHPLLRFFSSSNLFARECNPTQS